MASVLAMVPRHHARCPVGAVAVQVVIGAPPSSRTMLAFFAFAPLAPVFGGVMAMVMITHSPSASYVVTFCAIHLGRSLQGVRLGEKLLNGMNEVSNAARTLAALLSGRGSALVL